ncbi:Uncharacterised protein [Mycobacteroides abscessus]|nr:Uncharacterised protein [Mycobacteroides abscessus]
MPSVGVTSNVSMVGRTLSVTPRPSNSSQLTFIWPATLTK